MVRGRLARMASVCALGAMLMTVAIGCGSSDSSEQTSGGASTAAATGASTAGGATEAVAQARQAVEEGYAGTFTEPSTEGPPAQPGKNVFVISCQQAAGGGCYNGAAGFEQAAKLLGWNATIFDGQGNPERFNQGIRQAIAAKADAIVITAIDCPAIKSGLQEAKRAGIPTISMFSIDCDDPLIGDGQPLFTASSWGGPLGEFFQQMGVAMADYIVAKTEGQAKIVDVTSQEYAITTHRDKGMREQLEKTCPDCEIVATMDQPVAGLSNGQAAQRIQTLLQKHPDADVLVIPYDAMTFAIAQMLRSQNRDDLMVISSEGYPYTMQMIRDGTQTATIGWSSTAAGWASADVTNRVLAGESEFPEPWLGYRIIDKEHNLPTDTGKNANWSPNVDYEAAYEEIWGGNGQ